MIEEGRKVPERNIAIAIYGEADHSPAVLLIPFRIVGSAAKQRDSERGSADNHDAPD
jgi:hypothetical protein